MKRSISTLRVCVARVSRGRGDEGPSRWSPESRSRHISERETRPYALRISGSCHRIMPLCLYGRLDRAKTLQ